MGDGLRLLRIFLVLRRSLASVSTEKIAGSIVSLVVAAVCQRLLHVARGVRRARRNHHPLPLCVVVGHCDHHDSVAFWSAVRDTNDEPLRPAADPSAADTPPGLRPFCACRPTCQNPELELAVRASLSAKRIWHSCAQAQDCAIGVPASLVPSVVGCPEVKDQ